MKVSYYPGCTLKNKAKQLDIYAKKCAEVLGIELCEPDEWQCCGGAFTASGDEVVTKLSAVRSLCGARDMNIPLVTICSACHNVIKRTNLAMKNPEFADKVNRYMMQDKDFKEPYNGEVEIYHYIELLRDKVGFDKIREKVKNPLTGKKIGAYYGCLLLRPSSEMQFDDPENPNIMEGLISAMGAEPVKYSMRNECCGGYVTAFDTESAKLHSREIIEDAKANGVETIVTACPLCKYNLENCGELPVLYFTELLYKALGLEEDENDGK